MLLLDELIDEAGLLRRTPLVQHHLRALPRVGYRYRCRGADRGRLGVRRARVRVPARDRRRLRIVGQGVLVRQNRLQVRVVLVALPALPLLLLLLLLFGLAVQFGVFVVVGLAAHRLLVRLSFPRRHRRLVLGDGVDFRRLRPLSKSPFRRYENLDVHYGHDEQGYEERAEGGVDHVALYSGEGALLFHLEFGRLGPIVPSDQRW